MAGLSVGTALINTLITAGPLSGRSVGDLNAAELRKLAASRAQNSAAKRWIAAAKVRLALLEFDGDTQGGSSSAAAATTPASCTVLALRELPPATQRRPEKQQPRAPRTCGSWMGILQYVGFFALMLLACPPLAGIPGYTLGWLIRLLARRCADVWCHFIDAFKTVLGELFTDAAISVAAAATSAGPVLSNLPGLLMATSAWFFMRRVQ